MKLRRLQDRPGVDVRVVDAEVMDDYRRESDRRMMNEEGRVIWRKRDHVETPGLEPVTTDLAGTPVMEKPEAETPREGRETAAMLGDTIYRYLMGFAQSDPETFRARVQEIKALNPKLKGLADHHVIREGATLLGQEYAEKAYKVNRIGEGWKAPV
jgi:hypothetical protein